MKVPTLILVLALASPAQLPGDGPFSIDADKILAIAIEEIAEHFPDISPHDLALERDIYVHCWSTRFNEQIFALDEEFRPCLGGFVLELISTPPELRYVDRDDNCAIAINPKGVSAHLNEAGMHLTVSRGTDTKHRIVECNEEFDPQGAESPTQAFDDELINVDAKGVLNLAYATAIEKYSDISADDLELDGPLILSCRPVYSEGRTSAANVEFAPCTAQVSFRAPSSIIEHKYIDADGKCNIMRGPESIRVQIGGGGIDPECARGSFGVTEQLVVECTEEFDDAERWVRSD